MLRFRMAKGLVFIEGNKRLQLNRKLVNGNYQLESESGEVVNMTYEEMLKKWRTMEWVIDINSLGQSFEIFYLSTPADFASLSTKNQKIIERKKHYIDEVNPELNKYNFTRWAELIAKAGQKLKDENLPDPTTVANWWRRYKVTKSIHSLLPTAKLRKKVKVEKRYKFFEEVIKDLFLTKQKVQKINVVKNVNNLINKHNALNPEIPLKKIATSTIYRWIDELEQDLVEASRIGAETARIKQRVAMGGLKVIQPLARVELDHTPIDAMIVHSETFLPIGRPWLTLIIDVATRMILGFYISFNSPSAHSVLQALKMAIMPKDGILRELTDVKGVWPAMGIPVLLAVDNGMDLHSEALKQACFEMGIELMFTPAKTPFAKGTIERMIGTLNRELIHFLPGTVFSNVSERGEYEAEEKAAIDQKTLFTLIVKWIVEIYHNRPHKGLKGKAPLEDWIEKTEGMVLELPANPQLLDVITGIPATRTVFHYGVELDGLAYNSRQLQEIRHPSGDNPKIQLKFYEDQVVFIHVLNPITNEYFRVDCVHMEFANVHRETYRLTRAHARKRYGERHSIPQLLESLQEIQEMINAAVKHKKMGQRKFAARHKSDSNGSSMEKILGLKTRKCLNFHQGWTMICQKLILKNWMKKNDPEEILLKHATKKLPNDQTLVNFSLTAFVVEHSQFSIGMAAIAETHAKRNANKIGVGLLLMADSGFGKTVLLKQYQTLFPRQNLANKPIIPVLYVVLPSNPTSLAIVTEVLIALGDPLALKKGESAALKTQRLYQLLDACKVEVILMDEPHHVEISLNSAEFYIAQNWLKNLISIGKVAVVASGMQYSKNILHSNKELKRRFLKQVTLAAFSFSDESSFEEFRSILKKYGELLPFDCEIPLYERNLARRILIASGGLLDYLAKLLDGAVQIAQFMHKPIINTEVLAASFREYIWVDVPEKLNPFHPDSPLRKLDKFGEPFHLDYKIN